MILAAQQSPCRGVYLRSSTPQDIACTARELACTPDTTVAVFVASEGQPDLDAIVTALSAQDVRFLGGMFPGVIEGRAVHRDGALLLALPALVEPWLITELDNPPVSFPFLARSGGGQVSTAFVLVDGQAPNIGRLLDALYDVLGDRVHLWGGGAGTFDLTPKPCIFTRAGVHQAAAAILLSTVSASIGIRHGWTPLCGPFVATHTQGNVIFELNWRPAADVYREALRTHTSLPGDPRGFYETASHFPFGLHREGDEFVVRDPVTHGEGGCLICVGEVQENALLYILQGNHESLEQGAGQAAAVAAQGATLRACHALVADCVSRFMTLGDDFAVELSAIEAGLGGLAVGCPLNGILTIGEIAARGDGQPEFYNKTTVVAVLNEPAL